MSDLFRQPEDATPLMPEEVRQLIPAYIAYRSELNAAERSAESAIPSPRSSFANCTGECLATSGNGPGNSAGA